ncbi:MAG: hypothetical protein AAB307_04385, partial [Deltaproteobacteria bacterium]
KDGKGQPLYAIRKALSALTKNEIKLIADEKVRAIVMEHLKKNGADPENGNEKDPAWKKAMDQGNPPYWNGQPIPIKRVRLHKVSSGMIHLKRHKLDELPYRAVEPGSNHHIVIYEYTEGKKKGRWDGEVATMFEAARRLKDGEPVIKRDVGDGKKFVMSLSIGEMVRIGEPGEYYRVQKIGGNNQIMFRHNKAATISNDEEKLLIMPNPLKERKISKVFIDPIGRVKPAND